MLKKTAKSASMGSRYSPMMLLRMVCLGGPLGLRRCWFFFLGTPALL